MPIDSLFACTFANLPETFERFRSHLDVEWIEEALQAHGRASLRQRRLPAEEAAWLVISMALFRDEPIHRVVESLELKLGSAPVARSSVSDARKRLGHEPMEWLFVRSSQAWAHKPAREMAWRGLAVYGVDGTVVRVADSKENCAHFGKTKGGGKAASRGSGYPLVRMVVLSALRTHLLAGAFMGPYATGERELAEGLWGIVPDDSLTLLDRGYESVHIQHGLTSAGRNRHWMMRAKTNGKWRVVKRLGTGDFLVEKNVSKRAKQADKTLPNTWQMRAVHYRRPGFREEVILTSLVDPTLYPASEIRTLYHERWELELTYDEIKTDMLDRLETIRSKSPAGVMQELWGLLISYNLVRFEMGRIAHLAKLPPTRISFLATLRHICDFIFWTAGTDAPGAIPKRLQLRRERLSQFILPERRDRRYPRTVKIKLSGYNVRTTSIRGGKKVDLRR